MNEQTDDRKHLIALLEEFGTAMLVTKCPAGTIRGRPMGIAEVRKNGELWFVTGDDSPKVDEITGDTDVAVTFQGKTTYVSLSGKARVVHDPTQVDKLWNETWRTWFPAGKEDPTIAFVVVEPHTGEYWDHSGVKGLRYLFEATKALFSRTTPRIPHEQSAKVPM